MDKFPKFEKFVKLTTFDNQILLFCKVLRKREAVSSLTLDMVSKKSYFHT